MLLMCSAVETRELTKSTYFTLVVLRASSGQYLVLYASSTRRLTLPIVISIIAYGCWCSTRGDRSCYLYYGIRPLHLHVSWQAFSLMKLHLAHRLSSSKSREKVNDQNQVVIVDLADANNVLRRPSKHRLTDSQK